MVSKSLISLKNYVLLANVLLTGVKNGEKYGTKLNIVLKSVEIEKINNYYLEYKFVQSYLLKLNPQFKKS